MIINAIAGSSGSERIPGPADDYWYMPVLGRSATGITVTPMSAMRASACYACVKVLSETVASLPRIMFSRQADDTIKPQPQHPLQDVVEFSPNPQQTAFEFWEMQIAFGALYGNAYAEIVPGKRGAVDQLLPMRPDCVQVEKLTTGRLRFNYTDPLTGSKKVLTQDEVFRIPGFSFNGVEGIAPIYFASDPIGLALATEMFGAKFFSNDATPSVVLKHPQVLKEGGVERIRNMWKRAHSGLDNAHSVAVLEEGMTVESIGMNNKDSQFLETRKYQIAEIARYMRIPLHMIGELDRSTNNNIEQQAIEFVKYTLRPWLRRIESRVNLDLVMEPKKFFMHHDLDELLRGELKTRYEAFGIAIDKGFITRNEVRRKENMNPLPGLDAPLTPMNMSTGGEGTPPAKGGKTTDAQAAAAIPVRDAFDRIVSRETIDLAAIVKRQDALDDQLVAFYAKHKDFMVKALAPVARMCNALGLTAIDPYAYVTDYASARLDQVLLAADAQAHINQWAEHAAENLTAAWFASAQGENHAEEL